MNNEEIQYLIDNAEYDPQPLIDYITNLQEQLHQASLDIQELTERDIYCPSSCDKLTNLQGENKAIKIQVEVLEEINKLLSQRKEEYKSRIDKAIEWLDFDNMEKYFECPKKEMVELLNILQGEDNEI